MSEVGSDLEPARLWAWSESVASLVSADRSDSPFSKPPESQTGCGIARGIANRSGSRIAPGSRDSVNRASHPDRTESQAGSRDRGWDHGIAGRFS